MIEINSKWAIGAESHDIVLFRKQMPKEDGGEESWKEFEFYRTLRGAVNALIQQDIRDGSYSDLKQILQKLNEIELFLNNLPHITVTNISNASRKALN